MKKLTTCILLAVASTCISAQLVYNWAFNVGPPTSGAEANCMAMDKSGFVFVSGKFQGTMDFDPGTGVANQTSSGFTDIYLAKYDNAGNYIWVKSFGSNSGGDWPTDIAVDDSGNIYITGRYRAPIDCDPGPGVFTLPTVFGDDIFLSKYDSTGSFIWAKSLAGNGDDRSCSITIDSVMNVYITGSFQSACDFDPGPATVNLTANGASDLFFAKYDSSGNYVWAKGLGGATFNDEGRGIILNSNGDVSLTGYFSGTCDFNVGSGTYNLTAVGAYDAFFAKYDNDGNFIWAKRMNSTMTGNVVSYDIDTDSIGNIYLCGYFNSNSDFDPGVGTAYLSTAGNNDIFFAKYTAAGNYVWAKAIGGGGTDECFHIMLDRNAKILLSGFFPNIADFNPGPGTAYLSANGNNDIFFAHYDNNGNYLWAYSVGGYGDDRSYGFCQDSSGSVFIAGYFDAVCDFDPGAAVANLTPIGVVDLYVAKYSNLITTITSVEANYTEPYLYPNPTNNKIIIRFKGMLEVYTMLGEKVTEIDINADNVEVDISSIPAGIYLCRLISDSKIHIQSIIIQ